MAKGKAKIIVDGSFSRGTDIVKAICLGADWVGMGRLYCYGLAANGAAGIERVVELLEEEMKEVMGLLGVSSLKQLDKSYISQRHADQPARRALRLPAAATWKTRATAHRWEARPLQGASCLVHARRGLSRLMYERCRPPEAEQRTR